MKLFDCFLFFNELELLELRFMTLSSVVDYFVLVEANKTFTGWPKEFLFHKHRERYQKYGRNIIYVQVTDAPEAGTNVWAIEEFQRNCITRGLATAKDEDRVIISDVDEIPDPTTLLRVKESSRPVTFRQHLFYYYVNCLSNRGWNGPVITPMKTMGSPYKLRGLAKKGLNRVKNGGWHYSYMGGFENIKLKLANLSDAYLGIHQVGTDGDILRKMNSQKDLWDEKKSHRLVDVGANGYGPVTIQTFIKKYPDFYFGQR